MKTKLIAGILVVALVVTSVGVASARNNFKRYSSNGSRWWAAFWAVLDEPVDWRAKTINASTNARVQTGVTCTVQYWLSKLSGIRGWRWRWYLRPQEYLRLGLSAWIWVQMASPNFNYGRIARTETGQTDADRATIMHKRCECVGKTCTLYFLIFDYNAGQHDEKRFWTLLQRQNNC